MTHNKVKDFCAQKNGLVELRDRAVSEQKEFKFALFETTRLYAFAGGSLPDGTYLKGCLVLVLPEIDDRKDFPGGGEPCLEMYNFCEPLRPEWKANWGYKKCSVRRGRLDLGRIFGGEFLQHHPQQGVRDSLRLAQQAVVANLRTRFHCDDGRQRGHAFEVHPKRATKMQCASIF